MQDLEQPFAIRLNHKRANDEYFSQVLFFSTHLTWKTPFKDLRWLIVMSRAEMIVQFFYGRRSMGTVHTMVFEIAMLLVML